MIKVTFPDNRTEELPPETKGFQILDRFSVNPESIIAIRINNEICSLDLPITIRANLEPVTIQNSDGMNIYRRSLCFVLGTAASELFPEKNLVVGHSLGYGYYYTLGNNGKISEEDIAKLYERMKEIIRADEVITTEYIAYDEALELFDSNGSYSTSLILHTLSSPRVKINRCRNFKDISYAPLCYKTGILSVFELVPYQEGFLLRFPPTILVNKLSAFEDIPQLFSVYSTYKKWGKEIGVSFVGELNEKVNSKQIKEFIEITETLQTKKISEISDMILSREKVKVVLIAGPSSSGKTTTSKKLSMQLRVNGYEPRVIELDNYFVGREKTPRDKNGNFDYECLEALDIELLNQNLLDLFAGREIELPAYDFVKGIQYKSGKKLHLNEKSILILEGIHGLNDKLTPLIPSEKKFKLYLSALTQLNLDDHNRIPTRDNRLIRRIVRDSNFRGKNAADTIKMWPNVLAGERKHIFPYQDKADEMFNSALDYELGVLKVYAEPLLRMVKPTQKEFSEASRLLAFLNNFLPISSSYVPGQSIVREFIGGSDFKY